MENETVNSRDKNGKFVSGHHIGRPKGSGNKKLNVVKEKFQQLLDGYPVQQMQADLMEMEAGERLRLIVAMADFFMPKLNRVDNSLSIGSDTIIVLPPPLVPPNVGITPIPDNSAYSISPEGEKMTNLSGIKSEDNELKAIE